MAQISELMSEAIDHHVATRFAAAEDCYSRILALAPENAEAWRLRGVVALQTGANAVARAYMERAIALDPGNADAHGALGNVGEAQGVLDEAAWAYKAALAIEPTHSGATVGLARVTLGRGDAVEAIALARAALARGVSDAGLLRTFGAALINVRDYAGAIQALRASLALQPHPDAYGNLGAAYLHAHEIGPAIDACEAALARDPGHADSANNLGIAHKANGSFHAALAAFERAIELGSQAAHMNLGTTQLLLENYRDGWPHYGWNTSEREANPVSARLNLWDGRPAPDARLLVWPEQGVGDTIQMARFLARARGNVGSITLACPPGTVELLRTVAGGDAFVETSAPVATEQFDCWLPTIRLPVIFDVRPATIPAAPYLRADPERVARFADRLRAPGRLRVGLVWSGSPAFEWNDIRSCGLAELTPLGDVPGVTWFALQQGPALAQQARSAMPLVPINADVVDFADTAAIIAQLDLVITVDTSVAHLAGALGKPAWVLLSQRPDWRWGLRDAASPWYPTLRLFRKASDGPWSTVVADVAAALHESVERAAREAYSGGAAPVMRESDR